MKPNLLLLIGFAISFVLIGINLYDPSMYHGMSISQYFLDIIKSADPMTIYLIVFIVTIISNASVLIVIPYPLVLMYAAQSSVNLVILAIVAASAAAIGEMSSYVLGALGRKITEKHEAFYLKLRKVLERNKWKVCSAVFFAAMTPIPDDVILVPLGFARFGFLRSIIPCFFGKLILIAAIIFFSEMFINTIGNNSLIADLATIWLIIGIMYMAMRSDEKSSTKQLEKILDA
ncbi:MAG: hypothetical protein QXH55_04060 [Candidatus Korarchaeota archaeon]|nr:hypothetical protein [Thermoproteota archaeon]MCR8463086.1 hypothetical protein [Thermoproteota archaeon]MCR8470750.1 hypothetical protein [Thermoproteota archaeon]MCR8471950.1 hypothetical protein [Thermoproteota archaeon]MCR8473261.1 hypothetical protein [Thermoproteota archaeon]